MGHGLVTIGRKLLERKNHIAEWYFDFVYGLDTRRSVYPDALGTDPTLCGHYEPTDWFSLRCVLKKLPIHISTDVFLDLGSGKGRPLLVASAFPFRKIIGVEVHAGLCAIAKNNIDRWLQRHRILSGPIEIVHCNAIDYQIPPDVSIIFLQDPLPPKTLDVVLKNIEESIKAHPRKVLIIEFGTTYRERFAAMTRPPLVLSEAFPPSFFTQSPFSEPIMLYTVLLSVV